MSEAVKAFFDDVASCYDNVLPFFSEFGKAVAGALPAPTPGARAWMSGGWTPPSCGSPTARATW